MLQTTHSQQTPLRIIHKQASENIFDYQNDKNLNHDVIGGGGLFNFQCQKGIEIHSPLKSQQSPGEQAYMNSQFNSILNSIQGEDQKALTQEKSQATFQIDCGNQHMQCPSSPFIQYDRLPMPNNFQRFPMPR